MRATALQPDGKIVAAGYAPVSGFAADAVTRYLANGSLDPTFGTGGLVTPGYYRDDGVLVQPDGKIVAVGISYAGASDFVVARYNSDGSPDTTFGTGGHVRTDFGGHDDLAHGVVLQPDGKLVVAGSAAIDNGGTIRARFAVARYLANGSLDASFGAGGKVTTGFGLYSAEANAVALQPDGRIVAAGDDDNGGGNSFTVIRYNADGTLDSGFGSGGIVELNFAGFGSFAEALAMQPDGRLVIGGPCCPTPVFGGNAYHFGLARLLANGNLDASFGSGGLVNSAFTPAGDWLSALVLQGDGKVVTAGYSGTDNQSGEPINFELARYRADGSPDPAFGTSGLVVDFGGHLDAAAVLLLQPDGKLVAAGGTYDPATFTGGLALARYLGDAPAATGTPAVSPSPGTPLPTASSTATSAATPPLTSTLAPSATATATPPAPTATHTAAPSPTVPPTGTPPPTATPTRTATLTPDPTATAPPCTIRFSDVQPTDYFYTPVQYLFCHGVISGHTDGTFRPFAPTTRAQMVKIVVLGFQQPIATPTTGYTFADVPPAFPFFAAIETAAADNIVSGYACGGAGEPCDGQHRPYFRPYANVTRGQLSKITVLAAGWSLVAPSSATFADVAPGMAFYPFVETASCHAIVSGYTCGGPGEPCDAQRRPYFRQYNPATRGQIAKIAYGALTSGPVCTPP